MATLLAAMLLCRCSATKPDEAFDRLNLLASGGDASIYDAMDAKGGRPLIRVMAASTAARAAGLSICRSAGYKVTKNPVMFENK